MDDIKVKVYPDNRTVSAFRYAPTVILVRAKSVRDTDQSIVTDEFGRRYKRHVNETSGSYFFEYRMI